MSEDQAKYRAKAEARLKEKIENGATELQESYRLFIGLRKSALNNISRLEAQIAEEKVTLKSICNAIRKCHDRAAEQGYPNILKQTKQ